MPAGEANISYAAHPPHRGNGYVTRAARLDLEFLRDHTGARHAHLIVDEQNVASRQVVAALGAVPALRWHAPGGATMIRHVLAV
ncbi:GNAT family N-acetyltransferase [Pseudonocardia sp. GCM10023141]|uniref:GNAT family N-acetyltransferase n=1 Tax=Pseudonocardia sp. GCM10023141 TaxID=3252653 RepID=UPI00360ACADA